MPAMINQYVARKVALKDMQPCAICSKPSTTVLYNASGPDWLYTCDIHLQDNPQFASPIYSTEYNEALGKLKLVKSKIERLASAKNQIGSWDGWVTKIFSKKEKQKANSSENRESTTTETADAPPEVEGDPDTLLETQAEYGKILDEVAELRRTNRKYELAKIMFESRVLKKRTDQLNRERYLKEQENYSNTDPEELLRKHAFPSVPRQDKQ
ncbi:Vfa1p SKDI_05G1980 [Saccharomyces kudriavzevii IFO 1802]|uniref:VFA1-like protein n=2 Tax=Saccharomyces kudriavzevii (strain ATCC MYA-4449 / AS 2.2408 / CBS 8840 / NBRC 1802 / NCYC 2889) TaxID=226230 RepID=J6EFR4_SACK1|nr:uncharacterized protein SKDI_05G1980 [Saccharomyces kudriavzevii IFO 1802]EJT42362.1 VFA1-like protein [Saccharomyces kudriavzevii IFO 1802]CAI4060484.1 hypothetical protein SKDI_05G1980 [Saccharomyces kudriavzevii IFO 1802]